MHGCASSNRNWWTIPKVAKEECRRDRRGLPAADPGLALAIQEAAAWLMRAQDCSRSADGGVARHYSLVDGWGPSYPETTGYIVPTFFELANRTQRDEFRMRARRMLDWLVSIQLPNGAFQGGPAGAEPLLPAVFDTGQILMGLAAGARELHEERYFEAMRRAAEWLLDVQADDGSWLQPMAPFAMPGPKTYETHVAWGLLEAFQASRDRRYLDSAAANVRWASSLQHDNGWFPRCCLTNHAQPLTHTLGYALRGIIEVYRVTQDAALLKSARKCADGLTSAMRADGSLPGRLDSNWQGTVAWACLTGNVQIAICWLALFRETGSAAYREAACASNRFVRSTIRVDGPLAIRGGVKGSFPIEGWYGKYQYLNWAGKFFVDSNLLEQDVRGQAAPAVPEDIAPCRDAAIT